MINLHVLDTAEVHIGNLPTLPFESGQCIILTLVAVPTVFAAIHNGCPATVVTTCKN